MFRKKTIVLAAILLAVSLAAVGLQFSDSPLEFGRPSLQPGVRVGEQRGIAPFPAKQVEGVPSEDSGRMVIIRASLAIENPDVLGTMRKVELLAVRLGGYVASSSASIVDERNIATVTMRVPKEEFQRAMDEITVLGKIKDLRTNREDVTTQYIDLAARLKNLQRQEQRLLEILATARTTDEVLRVEKELERVRGEIERLTGQVKYLERNVEWAMITATITVPQKRVLPTMDWDRTVELALGVFFAMVRGIVIVAVALFPLLALGIPGFYAYRHIRARKVGFS